LAPLTLNPLSATQWAHLLTALAIWIGLPLLVGLWRIRRTDLA
jgi:ABC-2 type transport system permease protein